MTEKRKLAAILAADVVGFSRLTGSDEIWRAARHIRIANCILNRSGYDVYKWSGHDIIADHGEEPNAEGFRIFG